MFDTIEMLTSMLHDTADNAADLAVLVAEIRPQIRASVMSYSDIEDIKKVRNKVAYCLEDMSALADSFMGMSDVLGEALIRLEELSS